MARATWSEAQAEAHLRSLELFGMRFGLDRMRRRSARPEVAGGDTVLTGSLTDRSAVFGVLAQIEALGLELLELRQIRARPKSPESADNRSPDARY